MQPLAFAFYLALSLLARAALALSAPVAYFGWEKPSLYLAFLVAYYDDRLTKAWDGEL